MKGKEDLWGNSQQEEAREDGVESQSFSLLCVPKALRRGDMGLASPSTGCTYVSSADNIHSVPAGTVSALCILSLPTSRQPSELGCVISALRKGS